MRKRLVGWMISAAMVSGAAFAQESGEHAVQFESSEDGTTQPYRLYVPSAVANQTSLPLVVVLHGWGVDEIAWFKFTRVKRIAEEFGFVVAAPYARGNWWYRGPAERDVVEVVDDVRKRVHIDPDRIYLAGHSMGGWGTWWIASRHPDLFSAIAPMSGFDPQEFVLNCVNLAPSVIHDQLDDIVPVRFSRLPVQRMAELGISHQYREEIGYGHASRMIGDNLPRVFEWFRAHPRVGRPQRCAIATRVGHRNRWLVLLKTETWPKLARLDAVAEKNGPLRITAENVANFALHLSELPTSSGMPLRIAIGDWQTTLSATKGWAVFEAHPPTASRKRAGPKQWSIAYQHTLPQQAPVPEIRGKIGTRLREAHANGTLASAIAEILRVYFHAEVCVLDSDKIRVAAGELTTQKLLDAWVHPVERLARIQLTREEILGLNESISKGKPLVVPPAESLPRRRKLTVILPTLLAAQIPDWEKRAEIVSDSLNETLCELATRGR